MRDSIKEKLKTKRRIINILSVAVLAAFIALITWLIFGKFLRYSRNPEDFRKFIESYGSAGRFVAIGIQVLQIVIALLPGEFIEIGLGYAYGPLEGTLLCMAGIALGSALVFAVIKKWGVRVAEAFIDFEKINNLRFINSEQKLQRTLFILYFIPGTPKDLLTYFAGLTKINMSTFLFISTISRLPSVVTSTIGGGFLGNGEYLKATILLAVTAIVSILGIKLYTMITNKIHKKHK